jgi:hypothetical protein
VALDSAAPEIHLKPDGPAATLELKLATECAGKPATTVRIVLSPVAGDTGYTVSTSDEGPGGP